MGSRASASVASDGEGRRIGASLERVHAGAPTPVESGSQAHDPAQLDQEDDRDGADESEADQEDQEQAEECVEGCSIAVSFLRPSFRYEPDAVDRCPYWRDGAFYTIVRLRVI